MLLDHLHEKNTRLAIDDLTHQRSWAELYQRTLQWIGLIQSQGLKSGDHVALLMHNRVEFIEIVVASLFTGLWLIPINRHLTDTEVHFVLDDSDAKLIISESCFSLILDQQPTKSILVDDIDFEKVSHSEINLADESGAIMMYTSGTTGTPKGVKRAKPDTISEMLSQHERLGLSIGLDGSGPHLVAGPLYHAAPLLFALYDMANGASLILMPSFDAHQALTIIRDRVVHHTHWVPTMFVRALRYQQDFPKGFPNLQRVLHGAAPISIDLKLQILDWWGLTLIEYWGGTESGVVTIADSRQWIAHQGTVGKALPHYDVFATNSQGDILPAGEAGLLNIRNYNLQSPFSYYKTVPNLPCNDDFNGVFTLGDIGYVDKDGYVFLLDRQSHMIISGGVNIYPAEIEAVIQRHPAVNDVAVIGIPDDEWGEQVKAVIELVPGDYKKTLITEQISTLVSQHLAKYKRPRNYDFIDELPRYDSGKLFVRQIKERYWKIKD